MRRDEFAKESGLTAPEMREILRVPSWEADSQDISLVYVVTSAG